MNAETKRMMEFLKMSHDGAYPFTKGAVLRILIYDDSPERRAGIENDPCNFFTHYAIYFDTDPEYPWTVLKDVEGPEEISNEQFLNRYIRQDGPGYSDLGWKEVRSVEIVTDWAKVL